MYSYIYIYYTIICKYIYIHIPHISGVKYGYWLWINICTHTYIHIYILCIGIFHLSLGYKLQSSLGSSHCTCRRGQVQQTSHCTYPRFKRNNGCSSFKRCVSVKCMYIYIYHVCVNIYIYVYTCLAIL